MSEASPAGVESGPARAAAPAATCRALAWGFGRIGLSGIGGVLPYARHTIVETERWLDDREFTEILSVAQLLPGPNIANVAILLGTRFRGARGAAAALGGLFLPPLVVFVAIAILYRQIADVAWLQRVFVGIGAAAAGLILGMGVKLARALPRTAWAAAIALAALGAAVVARVPLPWVVIALAPAGIFCAWKWRG
jgi:chromate transporter